MPYAAQVFRILIASPSDVEEEREIAVRTIQEWNDLNSSERQIVLLPLRWETHSAPEYGKRPQEIINKQVVDHCDLLVGMFWARIGSPTGKAESGTLEEIERVAANGKTVMLYFSHAKQDPSLINIDQLAKLREFKTKTFPKALVESYGSVIEFRDKFTKQLEIQLRSILAEQSTENSTSLLNSEGPFTDIKFQFADPSTGKPIGSEVNVKASYVELLDFENIPDYEEKTPPPQKSPTDENLLVHFDHSPTNKDFFREYATYLIQRNMFVPVRFWLQNVGTVGARDVDIDISIKSSSPGIILAEKHTLPTRPPSQEVDHWEPSTDKYPSSVSEITARRSESWGTKLELRALQPQRVVSPDIEIFVGATESATITFHAMIYADTLSQPIEHRITLNLDVNTSSVTADLLTAQMKKRRRRPGPSQ